MLKTKDLSKAVEMEAKRKARRDRASQTIAGFDTDIEANTIFSDTRNDILAAILGAKNASLLEVIEQLEKLGVMVEN